MKKRVTVMIDDDIDKKLRAKQAKTIQKSQTSFSFSQALNEELRKTLWNNFVLLKILFMK